MRLIGIVLIILGVIAFIYQGLTFIVPKDFVDLGFMQVTVTETQKLPLPPIVGLIAVAVGAILILTAGRERT